MLKATRIQKKKLKAKIIKQINKSKIQKFEKPLTDTLKPVAGLALLNQINNAQELDQLLLAKPEIKTTLFDYLYLQDKLLIEDTHEEALAHLALVFNSVGLITFSKVITEAASKLSSIPEYMAALKSNAHSDYATKQGSSEETEYLTQLKKWAIATFSADCIQCDKNGTDRRPRKTKGKGDGDILPVD